MFSQVPKKIAGQLAQYSPVAALTMIVGHGTDAAFAAEPDPPSSLGGSDGLDGLGTSRLASLTSGGSCAEPTLAARPAVAATAPPPPQVIHEVIKQVPVPVPSSDGPTRVLVQHPEYHTTKVTNIDNHPTTVNTTVNQQINAGGDVTTSVNTNTVSGKGALGITDADHVDADGGPAAGEAPAPELDDDFGAGAKPDGEGDGTNNGGDGTAEGGDGADGGPAAGGDGSEAAPTHDPDEPVQPAPELHEGPPLDDGDPDGPVEEPQDSLAQAVHGGGDDPLAADLVGGPGGEALPHEVPPADAPNGDLLGHTLVGAEHHADPGAADHDGVDPAGHDDLVI